MAAIHPGCRWGQLARYVANPTVEAYIRMIYAPKERKLCFMSYFIWCSCRVWGLDQTPPPMMDKTELRSAAGHSRCADNHTVFPASQLEWPAAGQLTLIRTFICVFGQFEGNRTSDHMTGVCRRVWPTSTVNTQKEQVLKSKTLYGFYIKLLF